MKFQNEITNLEIRMTAAKNRAATFRKEAEGLVEKAKIKEAECIEKALKEDADASIMAEAIALLKAAQ